jgi:hypothetical protein
VGELVEQRDVHSRSTLSFTEFVITKRALAKTLLLDIGIVVTAAKH